MICKTCGDVPMSGEVCPGCLKDRCPDCGMSKPPAAARCAVCYADEQAKRRDARISLLRVATVRCRYGHGWGPHEGPTCPECGGPAEDRIGPAPVPGAFLSVDCGYGHGRSAIISHRDGRWCNVPYSRFVTAIGGSRPGRTVGEVLESLFDIYSERKSQCTRSR